MIIMIYGLFTDATHRTMQFFVDRFDSLKEFQSACEEQAGYFDGKQISEDEYNRIMGQP